MTRLPDGIARRGQVRATAPDHRGTRFRLALTDRGVLIRPLHARRPEAEVFVTWGTIYDREKLAQLERRLAEYERFKRRRRLARRR